MTKMVKSYSELIRLPTFEERFEYCALHGKVGISTFGSHRFLNQDFYSRPEWKKVRRKVIIRDCGCDLGIEGREIGDRIYIHHLNPVTMDDLICARPILFDPDNLICVSHNTHEAIHYGDKNLLFTGLTERRPNDTAPWRL